MIKVYVDEPFTIEELEREIDRVVPGAINNVGEAWWLRRLLTTILELQDKVEALENVNTTGNTES